MLDMATKAGVKVALLSPNAVDPRNKSNGAEYVETQKQFYAPLKDIAAKFEFPFVDQYAITRAAQDKMLVDDPKAEKAKPYQISLIGDNKVWHIVVKSYNCRNCKIYININKNTGEVLNFYRSED